MGRVVCEGCKSKFFTDNMVDYGDKFCSYCLPNVRVCPVCADIKFLKKENGIDSMCRDCKMKYHAFPNIYLILRFKCFQRDNFTCAYCGRSPICDSSIELHIDHIVPKCKGGDEDIRNLTTACKECNSGKMDVMLSEYQLNMIKKREIKNGISETAS